MIEEKYKVIRLSARNNLKHILRLLESNNNNLVYELELDPEGGDWFEVIPSPENIKKIIAIDPPGGPMIHLGDFLEVDKNYKLIDIHFDHGIILTYDNIF